MFPFRPTIFPGQAFSTRSYVAMMMVQIRLRIFVLRTRFESRRAYFFGIVSQNVSRAHHPCERCTRKITFSEAHSF